MRRIEATLIPSLRPSPRLSPGFEFKFRGRVSTFALRASADKRTRVPFDAFHLLRTGGFGFTYHRSPITDYLSLTDHPSSLIHNFLSFDVASRLPITDYRSPAFQSVNSYSIMLGSEVTLVMILSIPSLNLSTLFDES